MQINFSSLAQVRFSLERILITLQMNICSSPHPITVWKRGESQDEIFTKFLGKKKTPIESFLPKSAKTLELI